MRSIVEAYDRPVPRYTSYPTAPHFHAGIGPEVYERWLADTDPAQPLSLYLHVPFCRRLCWYCGCHTKVVASDRPVEEYSATLEREIALIADLLGEARQVTQIHWGGGTPNILAPERFLALSRAIHRRFLASADCEVAMEFDPRLATAPMMRAMTEAGVTRVSLGIQDFDVDVQRAVNRVQPFDLVRKTVDELREHGIKGLNLDLLYGLPHQTPEGLARSIDLANTLAPDRVALFGYAHVPWLKPHQRLIDTPALPDTPKRWALQEAANRRLLELGYVAIGFDHYARANDPMTRAMRSGRLRRNFQGYTTDSAAILVGLGPSAIGTLAQGYAQNALPVRDWRRAIAAGHPATVKGVALSDEDCLRRAIIERLLCDFAVDLDQLASENGLPGFDFGKERERLQHLARDGLIEIDADEITVTARGRPLVRFVAACFDAYLEAGGARHSKAV